MRLFTGTRARTLEAMLGDVETLRNAAPGLLGRTDEQVGAAARTMRDALLRLDEGNVSMRGDDAIRASRHTIRAETFDLAWALGAARWGGPIDDAWLGANVLAQVDAIDDAVRGAARARFWKAPHVPVQYAPPGTSGVPHVGDGPRRGAFVQTARVVWPMTRRTPSTGVDLGIASGIERTRDLPLARFTSEQRAAFTSIARQLGAGTPLSHADDVVRRAYPAQVAHSIDQLPAARRATAHDAILANTDLPPEQLDAALRHARADLVSHDGAALGPLARLRDDTVRLIDEELERTTAAAARRDDPYANKPEYATLGRIAANRTLFDRMLAVSNRTETLSW